jgi:hypothetical protein
VTAWNWLSVALPDHVRPSFLASVNLTDLGRAIRRYEGLLDTGQRSGGTKVLCDQRRTRCLGDVRFKGVGLPPTIFILAVLWLGWSRAPNTDDST